MTTTTKKTCATSIYFDNNGTTLICKPAEKIYIKWLKCYNASADNKLALPAQTLLENATNYVANHCNVNVATHTVLFTSGASESNCFIIKSCAKAYKKKSLEKGSMLKPHIITSATEHHSTIACINQLVEDEEIDATYIQPTIYGSILPADVEKAIKPNTCLISIMYANNEVPVINNIEEIGAIAHKNRVPMHSDCVQMFGKCKIDMPLTNLDALSASAHKFYGPKGVGILIINNKLIEGYGLKAEIHGSQQYGLRGGTENIPGIAATVAALKNTFIDRKEKNKHLLKLREEMLKELAKHFKFGDFKNYIDDSYKAEPLELISLGPPEEKIRHILTNTILLSIAKNKGKPFCNVDLKHALNAKNCFVSIGSACLTKSDKASHVLSAIGAPPVIKRGVIRISFGDNNTMSEVKTFVKLFKAAVDKQCSDLKAL